jgi:two-component system, chemotaxis family, chemotaxis protein CheY
MSKAKFVLVVEDEDEIRSMIVSSLKEAGSGLDLFIVEAKDGREAINFAGRQEFHCIITDLNMPRTTGEELIRVLLADSMNANTPTIVVSGNLSDEFLESFKNVRVVAKPFDPAELGQAIVREMKLGRMDERVPLHLLNPVLDSLQKILTEDMKLGQSACALKSPVVRKSGDKIEGEVHAIFTLTTGLTQARIGLTFQKNWLHWLRNEYFSTRRDQWAAMTHESTARQTTLAVVERAQSHLTSIMGAPPRIAELSIVDLQDSAKAFEAARSGGIVVAINTDQGQVLATAVAPIKVKRVAA